MSIRRRVRRAGGAVLRRAGLRGNRTAPAGPPPAPAGAGPAPGPAPKPRAEPTPAPPWYGGSLDDAFGHGYLVLPADAPRPPVTADWPGIGLTAFGLVIVHHPRTVVAVRRDGDHEVVLVGHPIDTESTEESRDPEVIAARALAALSRSAEAFTRYVGELGGRHTAYGLSPEGAVVVPDCCATQSVFWSVRGGRVVLSSHVELVAAAVGAEVDTEAIERVERIKSFRKSASRYFAGPDTAYREVLPLFANHRLRISSASGPVVHERFYPWGDLEPGTFEEVYPLFRDKLDQIARLLTGFGRTCLSLTCGDDSRTTLFAALPHLGPDDFAFTYYNPYLLTTNHLDDLFVPPRLAFDLGLRHKVVHARVPQPGDLFHEVFTTTWRAYTPPPGGACAMYESVPHGIVHLQSTLAEVATTSTLRRDDTPPTPEELTRLFQSQAAVTQPGYVDALARFVDYASFDPALMANHDWRDIFYWEHRLTRWTAQKAHEGDLGQRVLHPFNSRPLLEIMYRLPVAERQAKRVLQTRIEEGARDAGVRL